MVVVVVFRGEFVFVSVAEVVADGVVAKGSVWLPLTIECSFWLSFSATLFFLDSKGMKNNFIQILESCRKT